MSNLLIIGGAHVDRLARLKAPHRAHTSNPVEITEDVGGGCFNAGRAARRFAVNVSLLSARGADAAGGLVDQAIKSAGITDVSSVHLDRATPTYTAILAPDGELVTAIADMALYETAIARSFKRAPVQKLASLTDAVLIDANLPALALQGVFTDVAKGKPVYALAVSATKVMRLSQLLPQLECVFMNRYEAGALTDLPQSTSTFAFAEALQAKGLYRAVVSAGGEAAAFLDGKTIFNLLPPPMTINDVTGAGDCLAGTMVAALLDGFSYVEAAKLGLAAASLTASRPGASPEMSKAEIEALAALHDWKLN